MSPFFPTKAQQLGISSSVNGLIFACYPAGMSLTAFFAHKYILLFGTRTMISGCLAITSCCSLLFGFTPDLKNYFGFSDDIEILFFVIFFFLNGCFGGFIETGTTITLTHEFKHRIAVVTAGIGTFCGIGCMIGPPLGGVLYD
eukprot:UN05222